MTKTLLHQRTSLNSKINSKGKNKKVVRCGVTGDLIRQNFADKEVRGVDMLEASKEDGKAFRIF